MNSITRNLVDIVLLVLLLVAVVMFTDGEKQQAPDHAVHRI